jgi:hypothetical protein
LSSLENAVGTESNLQAVAFRARVSQLLAGPYALPAHMCLLPHHALLWLGGGLSIFAPAAEATPVGHDSAACAGGSARQSLTQWGAGMSSLPLKALAAPSVTWVTAGH